MWSASRLPATWSRLAATWDSRGRCFSSGISGVCLWGRVIDADDRPMSTARAPGIAASPAGWFVAEEGGDLAEEPEDPDCQRRRRQHRADHPTDEPRFESGDLCPNLGVLGPLVGAQVGDLRPNLCTHFGNLR